MKKSLSSILAAVLYISTVHGTILDTNFQDASFVNAGNQLTSMAWAPDGSNRLFVTLKTGEVVIVQNGTLLPTPFATLSPIFTGTECGLLGIWFDPNFLGNGYVYLFVTVSSGEQQIIRYTAVGNIGTSKTTLVSGLPTAGGIHNGGGIGIGPDGKIYWSIGDNGGGVGVNSDLTSLGSKVGRANRDGSVPLNNPFVDGPGGNNDYIWARGFRNPFTLNFHPVTGDLWVDCVGTSYEQVFLVKRADHAGYNNYENNQPAGYIIPKIKYRTNGTDSRDIAPGTGAGRSGNVATFTTTSVNGFRLGEKIAIAGVTDGSFNGSFFVSAVLSPFAFSVAQAGPDATSGGGTATTLNQGGCVTGGCFYDSTAVPAEYRQNFFYGDYNSGRLLRATLQSGTNVLTDDYLSTSGHSVNTIDIVVGPDGALYCGNLSGSVRRLAYTNYSAQQLVVTPTVVRMLEGGASTLNVRLATAPVGDVVVNVDRTSGDADLTVASGAALTFTPANWSVPQIARVQAAVDGDATDDVSIVTVSGPGMSEDITVHVLDTSHTFSLAVTSASGVTPVEFKLTGQPGSTYILERNASLDSAWTPFRTNLLAGTTTNIIDPGNLPARFYRARLVP